MADSSFLAPDVTDTVDGAGAQSYLSPGPHGDVGNSLRIPVFGAVNRHDGQWLAGVTVYVTDASGTNSVEIDMLVTADAITEVPATEGVSDKG
ncbi:hypothetical protein B2J88_02675 [Rhodococcus sp. SRB_17]|nr:hypothetical protein [Rhodococcus sp. SRB_17]